jgi:hypothetical protein
MVIELSEVAQPEGGGTCSLLSNAVGSVNLSVQHLALNPDEKGVRTIIRLIRP